MFGANKGATPEREQALDGKGLRIALVQARFNAPVTESLLAHCRQELMALGVHARDIDHYSVPGALEIPVVLQALAEKASHDALIALGCIIRGETYHFELVANESGAGVTRIALDYHVPVVNAILTTEDLAQAEARQEEKGREAARVAVEMINLLDRIG
jgi:6,7-dimethyl-8-ribityllumazine synthase